MRSNRLLLLALLSGTALLTACEPDKPEPPTAPGTAAAPAAAPAQHQELKQAVQEPLDKARAVEGQVMEAKAAQDAEMEKQEQ